MAEDETALREVDRQLAEDRARASLRKHAPLYIAGACAIVAGVAGWQIWTAQSRAKAENTAPSYRVALKKAGEEPVEGAIELKKISESAPAGYAVLADLRRATALSKSDDRAGALALFRAIYADPKTPKRLKDLARLRAAALAMPDGREAVVSDLGELVNDGAAFGFYARELSALAAYDAKDFAAAEQGFKSLQTAEGAPESVRARAEGFAALAASGSAGVNVAGEARASDLLKVFERRGAGGALPKPDDEHSEDDGHDHGAAAPSTASETAPQ